VKVGPSTADAVGAACGQITAAAAAAGVTLQGLLVAERVRGRRELMIGARIDPVFGPVVLVGDGAPVRRSHARRPGAAAARFDAARVEQALRRLRIAPLLDGVRGEPPLDVAAFCAAAVAVGALMADDDGQGAGIHATRHQPRDRRARAARAAPRSMRW
jgi:hypothetical protein